MDDEPQMQPQEGPRELTDDEKKRLVVGQCNYLLLMTLSLTAFILGQNAAWTCNFAKRTLNYYNGFDIDSTCAEGNFNTVEEEVCRSFLDNHGIGFYHWLGTIPVDVKVCFSYTMFIPEVGYVTPEFDSAFNAAEVFAIMANIFGAFGWFSVIFATCCPVSQERIAGLSCYFSLACICQSLTFLLYASNACDIGFFQQYFPNIDISNAIESVTCSLGDGAKMSITAAVLYAVCSSLAPFSTAPAPVRMGGYGRAPTNDYPTQQQQQAPPPDTAAAETPATEP